MTIIEYIKSRKSDGTYRVIRMIGAVLAAVLAVSSVGYKVSSYYGWFHNDDFTVARIERMEWFNISPKGRGRFSFITWKPRHTYNHCRVKPGDWTITLVDQDDITKRFHVNKPPVGELRGSNVEPIVANISYDVEPNAITGETIHAGLYTLIASVNWTPTHPEYKCDPLDYPSLTIRVLTQEQMANGDIDKLESEPYEDDEAKEWWAQSIKEYSE